MEISALSYFCLRFLSFFFNDTATTEIYTLSLHDALPISRSDVAGPARKMAAEQHLRPAGAPAAARRRHEPERQARRGADVDPRTARRAPEESVVQQLPLGDRSARLHAREFRRDRWLANGGRIAAAGRRRGHDRQ